MNHPAHGHGSRRPSQGAIIVVAQGTTQSEGKQVVEKCRDLVKSWYPGVVVRHAYTSEVVREVLSQAGEHVSSPLAAITSLMDEGHKRIVLQPLAVTPGTWYHGLYRAAQAMNTIAGPHDEMGLDGVLISRPLLLLTEDYQDAAMMISKLYASMPDDQAVALITPADDGDPALCQLQMVLDEQSKGRIIIGSAGGYPGLPQITRRLAHLGIKKVTIAPLTLVPGIHAWIDIAGENNDQSCLQMLRREGYDVTADGRTLGEYPEILNLFQKRLSETIKDHSFF